jgi:hypothetical protein
MDKNERESLSFFSHILYDIVRQSSSIDFFFQVICPLLIILRVVNGRAWKDNILTTTTPLEFATTSVGIEFSTTMNQDHSQISQIHLEDFDPSKSSSNTTCPAADGTGNPV